MGRPLGSKNKPKNALFEELREQDEEFVRQDNRKVLDVANGSNDSDSDESSESELESDSDFEIELSTEKVLPSTLPPPSTIAKTTSGKATTVAASKSVVQAKAVKTGRVKKPLDAVALTQRNLELFMRNVESKQNLQFELLNNNFLSFASSVEKSTKTICRAISGLSDNLFNLLTNNSKLAITRPAHGVRIKTEPKASSSDIIVLDNSPTLPVIASAARNFFPLHESTNIQSHSGSTSFQHNNPPNVCASNELPVNFLPPFKVDYERLIAVTSKSNDITKIAIIAFQEFWAAEIRSGIFKHGDYNVYGTAPKGMKVIKKPLDYQRLLLMQTFVQDKMPHGTDKDKSWRLCVGAINKKLHSMREKEIGDGGDGEEDEEEPVKRGVKPTLYNENIFKYQSNCDGPIFYQ